MKYSPSPILYFFSIVAVSTISSCTKLSKVFILDIWTKYFGLSKSLIDILSKEVIVILFTGYNISHLA